MSVDAFRLELRAVGISLTPEPDGRVRWRGPAGAMTSARRAALRVHRDALSEILRREAAGAVCEPVVSGAAEGESRSPSPSTEPRPPTTEGRSRAAREVDTPDAAGQVLALAGRMNLARIDLFGWGPCGGSEAAWREFAFERSNAAWRAHATEVLRLVLAGRPVQRRWYGPPEALAPGPERVAGVVRAQEERLNRPAEELMRLGSRLRYPEVQLNAWTRLLAGMEAWAAFSRSAKFRDVEAAIRSATESKRG